MFFNDWEEDDLRYAGEELFNSSNLAGDMGMQVGGDVASIQIKDMPDFDEDDRPVIRRYVQEINDNVPEVRYYPPDGGRKSDVLLKDDSFRNPVDENPLEKIEGILGWGTNERTIKGHAIRETELTTPRDSDYKELNAETQALITKSRLGVLSRKEKQRLERMSLMGTLPRY